MRQRQASRYTSAQRVVASTYGPAKKDRLIPQTTMSRSCFAERPNARTAIAISLLIVVLDTRRLSVLRHTDTIESTICFIA